MMLPLIKPPADPISGIASALMTSPDRQDDPDDWRRYFHADEVLDNATLPPPVEDEAAVASTAAADTLSSLEDATTDPNVPEGLLENNTATPADWSVEPPTSIMESQLLDEAAQPVGTVSDAVTHAGMVAPIPVVSASHDLENHPSNAAEGEDAFTTRPLVTPGNSPAPVLSQMPSPYYKPETPALPVPALTVQPNGQYSLTQVDVAGGVRFRENIPIIATPLPPGVVQDARPVQNAGRQSITVLPRSRTPFRHQVEHDGVRSMRGIGMPRTTMPGPDIQRNTLNNAYEPRPKANATATRAVDLISDHPSAHRHFRFGTVTTSHPQDRIATGEGTNPSRDWPPPPSTRHSVAANAAGPAPVAVAPARVDQSWAEPFNHPREPIAGDPPTMIAAVDATVPRNPKISNKPKAITPPPPPIPWDKHRPNPDQKAPIPDHGDTYISSPIPPAGDLQPASAIGIDRAPADTDIVSGIKSDNIAVPTTIKSNRFWHQTTTAVDGQHQDRQRDHIQTDQIGPSLESRHHSRLSSRATSGQRPESTLPATGTLAITDPGSDPVFASMAPPPPPLAKSGGRVVFHELSLRRADPAPAHPRTDHRSTATTTSASQQATNFEVPLSPPARPLIYDPVMISDDLMQMGTDADVFVSSTVTTPDIIATELPAANPTPPPTGSSPIRQVATAIVAADGDRIEMRLTPAHLGRLRLIMATDGDGLQVAIQVERHDTLELLRRSTPELLEDLRNSGFADADLSFSHAPDSGPDDGLGEAPLRHDDSPPLPPAKPADSRSWSMVSSTLDLRL